MKKPYTHDDIINRMIRDYVRLGIPEDVARAQVLRYAYADYPYGKTLAVCNTKLK